MNPTSLTGGMLGTKRPANSLVVLGVLFAYLIILLFFYLGWAPLSFGLAACLVYFWLSVRYPDKAFLALLVVSIILPIDVAIKFSNFPRVGPTRVVVAVFILGVFFRGLVLKDHLLDLRKCPLKGPIALFFFLAAISSLLSINPIQSLYSLAGFGFEQFLLFFVALGLLKKPSFIISTKKSLYVITAVVCIFAIFEEIFKTNPFMSIYAGEELIFRASILRVRSTFFHPIAFGCFLTLVFPFVIVDLFRRHRKNRRWPLVLLSFMILAGLFLTISRGPWVALLLETVLLFLIWPKKEKYGKAIGFSIALLILVAAIGIYKNDAYVSDMFNAYVNPHDIRLDSVNESSSEYYRFALAKSVTGKMYGYRWLIGFGPGTFYIADVGSMYAGHKHTLTAADSHYLKLLFEHGMLGLLSFALLLALIIKNCRKAIRSNRHQFNHNAAAATCAIAGFIFENITVSMFLLLPLTMLFWLYTAMVMPKKTSLSSA